MGFSSLEAGAIVNGGAIDRGLLGKGAGHIVYRLAKEKKYGYKRSRAKVSR